LLDLAGVHDLDADRHAELVAAFAHPFQRFRAQSLEGIGAGSRFIDAAAKHGGPAVADMAGDAIEHLLVFDGAGPGNAGGVIGADLHLGDRPAADFNDRVIFVKLAAGELVRLHDGDDFFHAVQGRQMVLVDQPFLADGADDGAEAPLAEMRLASHALDFVDHAVNGRLGRV